MSVREEAIAYISIYRHLRSSRAFPWAVAMTAQREAVARIIRGILPLDKLGDAELAVDAIIAEHIAPLEAEFPPLSTRRRRAVTTRDLKAIARKWRTEANRHRPKPEIARPLAEWAEEDGNVLWWRFPIDEPPYVGTPNDCGQGVQVTVGADDFVAHVGGWPGYHTHWTRLPPLPEPPR